MKKINITEIFDYCNGSLYWKISPAQNVPVGRQAGYETSLGYRMIRFNKQSYFEHTLIFILFNDYRPTEIDHINGIRNDNRIENLREATSSQNQYNTKLLKRNTSGVKGVNWHKTSKKWEVRIGVNNKRICLGVYDDIELAELVAQEARHKYHQEFARHI